MIYSGYHYPRVETKKKRYPCLICFLNCSDTKVLAKHYVDEHRSNEYGRLGYAEKVLRTASEVMPRQMIPEDCSLLAVEPVRLAPIMSQVDQVRETRVSDLLNSGESIVLKVL